MNMITVVFLPLFLIPYFLLLILILSKPLQTGRKPILLTSCPRRPPDPPGTDFGSLFPNLAKISIFSQWELNPEDSGFQGRIRKP